MINATPRPFYPRCGMCYDGCVMVSSSEQLSLGFFGEINTHYSHVNASLFLKMIKLGFLLLLLLLLLFGRASLI
jgi:hypothetical protein